MPIETILVERMRRGVSDGDLDLNARFHSGSGDRCRMKQSESMRKVWAKWSGGYGEKNFRRKMQKEEDIKQPYVSFSEKIDQSRF